MSLRTVFRHKWHRVVRREPDDYLNEEETE
jgi:hypothetical protein